MSSFLENDLSDALASIDPALLARIREDAAREAIVASQPKGATATDARLAGLPRLMAGRGAAPAGLYNVHGVAVAFAGGAYYVGDIARAWPALNKCESCGGARTSNVISPCQRGTGGLAFILDSDHAAGCQKTPGTYLAAYPAGVRVQKGLGAPLVLEMGCIGSDGQPQE